MNYVFISTASGVMVSPMVTGDDTTVFPIRIWKDMDGLTGYVLTVGVSYVKKYISEILMVTHVSVMY